jgi:hypothetical protein
LNKNVSERNKVWGGVKVGCCWRTEDSTANMLGDVTRLLKEPQVVEDRDPHCKREAPFLLFRCSAKCLSYLMFKHKMIEKERKANAETLQAIKKEAGEKFLMLKLSPGTCGDIGQRLFKPSPVRTFWEPPS